MSRSKERPVTDSHRNIGLLFLMVIVVMLFSTGFALADNSTSSESSNNVTIEATATPTEVVTEATATPTEVVTEVNATPTEAVTEVNATPTEQILGITALPPTQGIEATTATLPPYDPNFVRTIDEEGNLFTIRATYKKVTNEERAAAAARFRAIYEKYLLEQGGDDGGDYGIEQIPGQTGVMDPGGVPHYMGPYGNYAYSPMPWGPITSVTLVNGGFNYTNATTIDVVDYWGTGSGAIVNITNVDVNGTIQGLTLVNGGNQYTAPWLIINDTTRLGFNGSATASIQNLTPNGTYTKGIRKFVDTLPGLGPAGANNLLNYIPVATANTTAYPAGGVGYTSAPTITIYDDTGTGATAVPVMAGSIVASVNVTNGGGNYSFHPAVVFNGGGATTQAIAGTPTVVNGVITAIPLTGADYYELELVAFSQKFHSDLPNTSGLWGYRQTNMGGTPPLYLGPVIVASRDKPVRIKLVNNLPANGPTANLSVPVDFTIMGAGMGHLGMNVSPGNPVYYTQNRATIHLHGGITPWISDGTPFQWTTPNGTLTDYPRGVSVYNVPDMPNPGPNPSQGNLTFYYTNQQSARLLFYHDHAEGITRLNVYVGEASAYPITDPVEQDMIAGTNVTGVNPLNLKVLPDIGIPLVIQDKTFVDNATIAYQDPTWNWGTNTPAGNGTRAPKTGDLWTPHVYMPAENPWDPRGVNAFGRWPYAPWEYPERTGRHGPIYNIYYDPFNRPWEPLLTPGTPNPSMVPEAFQDTPMVNGALYPVLTVEPKAYRFRILSAANDRFFSLNLYKANASLYTNALGRPTELDLIPNWDTSNGTNTINPVVPANGTAGPAFWKIGTEAGFLPQPVVVPPQPTTYDAAGNVLLHGLALGCAERADVIVDFSGFAGQDLILYNDAPTPWPAPSDLYNQYTGNSDLTSSGGTPPTLPGYGPNARTIMLIRVGTTVTTPTPSVTLANLTAVFAKTAGKNGVYEVSADEIIVPESAYNSAFNATFADTFVNLAQTAVSFTALQGYAVNNYPITDKLLMDAFPDAYDEYGRLIGLLGLTTPGGPTGQISKLYGYTSPPIDFIKATIRGSQIGSATDGTQIWRITHAGTDTHPIHWHLYTVQPINRVNLSDGVILPIPNDEIGWRETFRVNPFQATIVALRPYSVNLPWDLPNSHREISPSDPAGAIIQQGPGGWGFLDMIGQPIQVVNKAINYGGEFVFHCHILGHEEGDMMHAVVFGDYPNAPLNPRAANVGNFTNPRINLTWTDNSMDETNWTIQRATNASGPWTDLTTIASTTEAFMNMTVTYTDNTVVNNTTYYYRVMAVNIMGDTTTYPSNVPFPTLRVNSTPSDTAVARIIRTDKIGVYLNGSWYLDMNGDGIFGPGDVNYGFGAAGWKPVPSNWNGSGLSQIGVYQNGSWYLDLSGNGTWGAGDAYYSFGAPGYDPVWGDWNRTGKSCIGVFAGLSWFLDWNGNGTWDGTDKVYSFVPPGTPFGWSPIVGDWTGNGTSKIGLYQNGTWNLDMNGDGAWGVGDVTYGFGSPGWTPVLGDWTGNGVTKIGVYQNGTWYLDMNGDGAWGVGDVLYGFGSPGWTPVLGDWTGNGVTKIGVYQNGSWYLDLTGNGAWGPGDAYYSFGAAGWTSIIGKWA